MCYGDQAEEGTFVLDIWRLIKSSLESIVVD